MKNSIKKLIFSFWALTIITAVTFEDSISDRVNIPVIEITAQAEESDFTFDLSTGTITGFTGNSTVVSVPSYINGSKVNIIDSEAFAGCSFLTNVIIPSGVISIGDRAFSGCSNLSDISIPSTVSHIGSSAFENTKWLENKKAENPLVISGNILIDGSECKGDILIPDSVTYISENAFSDCQSLTGVIFSNQSKPINIDSHAFYNCKGLKYIEIPQTVLNIGSYSFADCTDLKTVSFSESTPGIGIGGSVEYYAYSVSLNEPVYSASNKLLINRSDFNAVGQNVYALNLNNSTEENGLSEENENNSIGKYAFSGCKSLESIAIPDSVNIICENAFEECIDLKIINIPSEVSEICKNAFYGCSSLETVTIPKNVSVIGGYAFEGTPWLESKRNENPLVVINKILIDGKYCTGNVVIPENVGTIGDYAFYNCTKTDSIEIPYSVTSIGYSPFSESVLQNKVFFMRSENEMSEVKIKDETELFKTIKPVFGHRHIKGYSLALDGTLKARAVFDYEIDLSDGWTVNEIPFSTTDRIITYDVAAKNFSDKIVIKHGENVISSFSVADMLDKYKCLESTNSIASAIEKYCTAAFQYFSEQPVDDYSSSWDIIKNSIEVKEFNNSVNYIGSSLLLKSGTILRHYYKKNFPGASEKNGVFYIDRTVPAHMFSDTNIFCVNDFIYKVLENADSTSDYKNLCSALYMYGEASREYLSAQNPD